MSTTETIKPYTGPAETPENFETAFPELVRAAQGLSRGRNPLDDQSQRNLDELRRQVRSNPFKHATVVNLHPWPLSINSDRFVRGIIIPACNPGMEFAYGHIRTWSHDHSYNEDGMSFKFTAIKQIDKAAQFLVQFSDPEMYGGGVIIYEGESHPSKVGEVETYRPDGRPEVTLKNIVEYDDEGHKIPSVQELPVKRSLMEMITEQRQRRNQFYMSKVEWADSKWKSADVKDRRLITNTHRLMAEMLHAEGVLPVVPDWNLATRMELGLAAANCKGCGTPVNETAFKCVTCGHILKALEAYEAGAINWEHAAMDTMSADEWLKAEEIKSAREAARATAQSKRPKAEKD
jgi:hypothetical protein